MKIISVLLPFVLFLLTEACGNKATESKINNYQIAFTFDSINIIDWKGQKQGIWIVKKDTRNQSVLIPSIDTIVYKNDTAYPVNINNIEEVINKLNKK